MKTPIFAWIFALTLVCASAFALPINVEEVRIDGITVLENQVNLLDLQRNTDHLVEIKFTPTQDVRNAELEIFVSGFEYKNINPISDATGVFDADANVTYVKRLAFKLTDEVQEDSYKMRLIVSDRYGVETTKNYNLKLDVPRHSLKVEDVVFSPNGNVKSGQSLLTTVRIENKGEMTENDIRVEIGIPDLGIKGVDYIDQIKSTREESTEEIFMKIPACVAEGDYPVTVKVLYNQLHDLEIAQGRVHILGCTNTTVTPVVTPTITFNQTQPIVVTQEEADDGTSTTLRRGLEVTLVVLLMVLIILGIAVAITRMNQE